MLTIGNFDGVHRGHRALLQGLQEEGRKRNLPVMVMLFQPQPLELFATDKAPARLTRLREKLRHLAECGVDYVLCVRFDRRFAALTAQNFISDFLVKHLRVKFLAVGDDFRFGAGREGDFCHYRKLAWNTASISPVRKLFAKVACVSAAPLCVRRWRMTIGSGRKFTGAPVCHLRRCSPR
ncbi:hypothetical protein ACLK17_00160 [Escherichia coli]